MWDALVPMLGVLRRRDLVWRNCHGGPWAPGRGIVPSQQLRLTAQGQVMYLHQTEVVLLVYIVDRTGLACDPTKLAAVRNWHAPDKVKGVPQFVGFVGYYRRFVIDFADLAEPLVALTGKGSPLTRIAYAVYPLAPWKWNIYTDTSVGGQLKMWENEDLRRICPCYSKIAVKYNITVNMLINEQVMNDRTRIYI